MFPVSWLIQSRLADVATIVDENVNGVRVVKSFAAEQQQLRSLSGAAEQAPVELHQRRRPPGPLLPAGPEPAPGGPGPGAPVRRLHGHPRPSEHRGHPGLQRLPADAAGPVHDAGHAHHDGAAGGGLGRPHLRDPRRAAHRDRRPRRHRPGRLPRRRALRPRRLRLRPGRRAAGAGRLRPPHRPGRDRGPGRPDRRRQVDGGPAADPLLRREARIDRDRRPRRPGPHPGQPAGQRRGRARRAVPLLGVHPGQHRLRQARRPRSTRWRRRPGPPEPTSSSPSWPTATTRWSASGATPSRAASASASPSPGPCWSTRPIMVLDDATSAIDVQVEQTDPRRPAGADGGPDHPHHRPPAVHHRPGRPGPPPRPAQDRGRRHPRRAARDHARSTPRCWPRRREFETGGRRRRSDEQRPVPTTARQTTAGPTVSPSGTCSTLCGGGGRS